MGPIASEERIDVVDVVRGFALFGILVANWRGFGWPAEFYDAPYSVFRTAPDRAAQILIDILFGNKFISLFSFLFGLGFAIQMERAERAGNGFLRLYSRRVAGLAALGLAHGFLLWWGDILLTYAAGGLLLLLFRRCRQRTLLIWTTCLLLVPFLHGVGRMVAALYTAAPSRPSASLPGAILERATQAYLFGSWSGLRRQLMHDWEVNNAYFHLTVISVLPKFLFGMYVWRSGLPRRLREEVPLLRKVFFWCIALGLAGSAATVAIDRLSLSLPVWIALPVRLVRTLAAPTLSAGYAAGIALFALSGAWPWLRRGFAAAGRTALSNYFFQSVAGTFLHYGYGLALYGKVGAALGLPMSAAVFAVELPLSCWWIKRFRFGPFEWLWRSLTYWRLPPLRNHGHSAAAAAPTG